MKRQRASVDSGQWTVDRLCCALSIFVSALTLGAPPSAANPDTATLQSALVWRADGAGDYPLPEPAESTTYELPEAVPTSGQIKSITATWAFEGRVTLELSADGGLHYTPAVYGVPLREALAGGNRLKWRASLEPASRLTEVQLVYTDSSAVIGDFGEPRLSGFSFRKPIRITGSSVGALFHYQMPLLIGESEETAVSDVHCAGRLRSDFADIRFTTADGQTLLSHYREAVLGDSPGRMAVVWVRIPHLPPEGLTLYLYYGNPAAADLSDGRAVFDFFDDFEGGSLDAKAWDIRVEGQGRAVVSGSQAHLTSASMRSKTFRFADGVVEYLATTATAQDDARLISRSDPDADHPDETAQVVYASAYGGAEHAVAVGNVVKANDPKPVAATAPSLYRVITHGTSLTFERYDPELGDLQATVTYDDAGGLTSGAIGLHSDGSASYDWIRVRQEVQPAPAVSLETALAPEEATNLPVFTNAAIAPNGNLVPADASAGGRYLSAELSTSFVTRILVPRWSGQPEAVDLSADGGVSYLAGCRHGVHYYASKRAFAPGTRLKAQVSLRATDATRSPALESLTIDYAAGDLVVVSPNGGEGIATGGSHEITWTASGYEMTYPIRLDYSLDGGKTYHLIQDAVENDGTYVWSLPEELASTDALVKVSDGHDPSRFDLSDEPFAIGAAAPRPSQGSADVKAPAQSVASAPPASSEGLTMEDLYAVLDAVSADPTATSHELLIKVTEEVGAEPSTDALRYEAGDIVLIRPAGSEWSEAEKNSYLILQANLTPEAVGLLMSPVEVPTGEVDAEGKPVTRLAGRRKFQIDLTLFDLKSNASDQGKPPVLKYFKQREAIEEILKEPTGYGQTPGLSTVPQ
ncbi:MAG: DUF2341 domain-containing protein [Candidatus Omnitrophota bacterium]|nr:DUF2341 domain-containing protein [Candidatus Omnitrophota bacterium]